MKQSCHIAWHALTAGEATEWLRSDAVSGLAASEVALRQLQHGKNRLAEAAGPAHLQLLLGQFRNLLVVLLLVAAVFAALIGKYLDAVVILLVLLFNGLLGFYQEYRAEKTLDALRRMRVLHALVRRAGETQEIPVEELVPGDVVLLGAGDQVPADGRILQAHGVEADEAALTGEALPVGKQAGEVLAEDVPLAERSNLLFMNSVITRGRAELLVTATGMQTEMGRLAHMLADVGEQATPLQQQLGDLGRRLAMLAGLIVGIIFVMGLLRKQALVDSVLTAIALAVAAIPEGLPAVVTVTLAIGMHRMARQRAIARRLAAVETLGCTTVICADKTGTMTQNRMHAERIYLHGRLQHLRDIGEDADLQDLLLPAVFCNNARNEPGGLLGEPTEVALLALAGARGLDVAKLLRSQPRIAEIPFDSAHKFMATFHSADGYISLWAKGALEALLPYCTSTLSESGVESLDEPAREAILKAGGQLAGSAMRVLAVAGTRLPLDGFHPDGDLSGQLGELVFIGLIGLVDPPRPEVAEAIRLCSSAGIRIKMLTGDHPATAQAIARELELPGLDRDGGMLGGAELDKLSGEALADAIANAAVIARMAPEHKVKIVQVLKARGEVVAMTGDGINDAPAIRHADIGVAMGKSGTEVTRQAADIVLTDDNFATLVSAVREGRTIYDNIVKFVRFQLATNIAALLSVFAAPLLGLPLPFTPIQILFINIIMDGPPAMSLGLEPPRPGLMEEPPRTRQAQILERGRLVHLLLSGTFMAAGTLGMLFWALQRFAADYALTLAFTLFVWFQLFNALNARHEQGSIFNHNLLQNRIFWLALAGAGLMQWLVVYAPPLQAIFHTVDLELQHALLLVLLASSILWLEELYKWCKKSRAVQVPDTRTDN